VCAHSSAWRGFTSDTQSPARLSDAVEHKRQIWHQKDAFPQKWQIRISLFLKQKTEQTARFSTKRTITPNRHPHGVVVQGGLTGRVRSATPKAGEAALSLARGNAIESR
jgi:hypothetical protein